MTVLCWVGVGSASVVALGWLGDPLVLQLLARARRTPPAAPRLDGSGVSVVIATRETPETVRRRLADLRAGDTSPDGLEIVVAVDATSLYALEEYERAGSASARIVAGDAPGGKACTLNAAVRRSSRPVLIFADSFQSFAGDSISRLAAALADPSVGAATGTLVFGSDTPSSPVLRAFWRYELMLRRLEAELDSVVAVTGAAYGLRRELWRPLPAGLICDDLFVPLHVVRQGFRVSALLDAVAVDPRSFTRAQEFRRKVRTLTGMIQFCLLCPCVLSPLHNRIWFQFLCHKLLRLATPYLLLVALGSALGCLDGLTAFSLVAAALLAVALLGRFGTGALRQLHGQVIWAGSLLLAPFVATIHAVRGKWNVW